MKVLSIGNSFSVDSVEHLFGVLQALGEEEIILANMYIGGCSLDRHAENAEKNLPEYELFINCSGEWECRPGTTLEQALTLGEWDYISLQQQSSQSGRPDTFAKLEFLIDYVRAYQPNAKLLWNMTWAYPSNSDAFDQFAYFNNDRLTMYGAIVKTTREVIVPRNQFTVIPTGTAIENVRTSFVGDTLNRDGIHLSYGLGRYVASLAWAKVLTGKSLRGMAFAPNGVNEREKLVAVEGAESAIKTPYTVTQSAYRGA